MAIGAGSMVFFSTDFAASWATSMTVTLPSDAGSVFALAFASPSRLFIGTTLGRVFRADRTGNSWSVARLDDVAAGPLGLTGLVTDLAVDWTDAPLSAVYLCFGGVGDRRHVWRFDGTRWEARSGPNGVGGLLEGRHRA